MRSLIIVLPSLASGLIGAIWLYFQPQVVEPRLEPRLPLGIALMLGVGTAGVLVAGAYVLERVLPSFAKASRLLQHALARFNINLVTALLLAVISGVSEEVLFRGALLNWLTTFSPGYLAVFLQAVLFAAFHPMPRWAWSYTFYTLIAGVVLGFLVTITGTLWSGVTAHILVNFHGFLEVRSHAKSGAWGISITTQQRAEDVPDDGKVTDDSNT
ncbi:MAG: CPBP family intramembrane glutamic endopeptidase [Deinococcota bacterium]